MAKIIKLNVKLIIKVPSKMWIPNLAVINSLYFLDKKYSELLII